MKICLFKHLFSWTLSINNGENSAVHTFIIIVEKMIKKQLSSLIELFIYAKGYALYFSLQFII